MERKCDILLSNQSNGKVVGEFLLCKSNKTLLSMLFLENNQP